MTWKIHSYQGRLHSYHKRAYCIAGGETFQSTVVVLRTIHARFSHILIKVGFTSDTYNKFKYFGIPSTLQWELYSLLLSLIDCQYHVSCAYICVCVCVCVYIPLHTYCLTTQGSWGSGNIDIRTLINPR